MSFTAFNLHPHLLRAVERMGFTTPTPIQRDAIPPAMAGRDVLACAVTGSGKTAAFLLPILHRLAGRRGLTRALIITPTRELAAQIDDHRRQLAQDVGIGGAAVYGGVGMEPQAQAFRRGADVLVATPGRLLDHFRFPYARLAGLEVLVLDEADRMLDMGFLPDIKRILKHLPPLKQTLLFSATMPPPIAALARELLRDPAAINVERPSAPAKGITQTAYPVPRELKSALLLALLKLPEVRSVLAFTRTKHRANRLADFLERQGVASDRIHGNRSQAQRTKALARFKGGELSVLVATDIAARGIDITGLSHVVNFDVPAVPEDYIHRVGRTARMEALGDALSLVAPEEEADFRTIERHLGARIERAVVPGFDYRKPATERFEVPIAERLAAHRARQGRGRSGGQARHGRQGSLGR
ncbi:MAG TPA: DEAD/DEAH box helicase [Methylomirabilota bacterium]|nr:DEAD/DEAH box helicase [Methylomirabilota bacterium]